MLSTTKILAEPKKLFYLFLNLQILKDISMFNWPAEVQMDDKNDFYTIDEMAEKLKVPKDSIYHQIHHGREGKSLPPFEKSGKNIRFKVKDYEEWVKNLSEWRKGI